MSASNKLFNVILIAALGLVGIFAGLFLLLSSDRAASALYETGMERLEAGDPEQAREAFRRALARSDNKAPAAYQLARISAREEQLPDAMDYIRVALSEGRPTVAMYPQMTRLAVRAGDVGLAEELLARLQRADPANEELLTLRGILAVRRNQFAEALNLFEEAYSSGGASSELKLLLGQLLSRSSRPLDRTRAKVILMEAAEGEDDHAKNALLYIVASGALQMEARDWQNLLELAAGNDVLSWPSVKENLPVLRRFMLIARRHYPELAPRIADVRASHPEAETADFLDAAAMAQRERNLRQAERYLAMIPASEQDSIGARIVKANQVVLEGKPGEGVPLLQAIHEESPEELALLSILRDLAGASNELLTVREQTAVLEMIIAHPYASIADQLAAYTLMLELRPLQNTRIMEDVRDRLGPHDPVRIAQWFLNRDEPARALEVVRPEMAETDGSLFELRLLGLLKSGQIDAAAEMVSARPPAISSSLMLISRLRIAIAQEDADQARELWIQAVEQADRPGMQQTLPMLANMASAFGADDLALEGFDRAFARGARLSEGDWQHYTSLAGRTRSLERQLRVTQAARVAFPDNPIFINNAAYLELLAGLNIRENLQRMERIVEAHPDQDGFRVTLALAYLRSKRPSLAVRTVERVELDWSPAGASAQAVYIASLAEGNQRPMAENFAKNVDTSVLMNEEYELIQSLLNR